MTHRVGPKGQVVIPKAMRDELGLSPGDEVAFSLQDGSVLVRAARGARSLGGMFKGHRLTGALEAERRREQERERRRGR